MNPKYRTVRAIVNGKGAEVARGLTPDEAARERDRLVQKYACSGLLHDGPCRFPFKRCDGGAIIIVEEE